MSVHSYDGSTWSTNLKRISERSANDRGMAFNNVGHIITVDMLKELFHQLNGRKAIGIDGVTKMQYGENLEYNLEQLMTRIRRGLYQPKASRLVDIPKEDGSTRPLAIACFEDKLIQLAASTIITAIFEPLFLDCSFGFRAKRNCHGALRELNRQTIMNWKGAVIEIDIRKYFNTIPHMELAKILGKKISDKRFLKLLDTLITAPTMINDVEIPNAEGCPQGSILSPILANVYLHCVIDKWFEKIKESHIKGRANMVRYADDMVFTFQSKTEAERFFKVLPKRLARFGLEIHLDKSQLLKAGHTEAMKANKRKEKLATFNFLGFTCYWGKSRAGFWRLMYTSRRDRFAGKLKSMREFLWRNLATPDEKQLMKRLIRVVKGWMAYHAISDNGRRVKQFLYLTRRLLFKWVNRRGRRCKINWDKFSQYLERVNFPSRWKVTSVLNVS